MDSRRLFGDEQFHQQPNELFKAPEECWCKAASNFGEVKCVQNFMAHLKPLIGEEVEKALNRVLGPCLPLLQQCALPPNSSTLPHQAEPPTSRCLKLQFKNDAPNTSFFTMTNLEDGGYLLEVELVDESGKRVEDGPESSVKIKIDVLDGDFNVEDGNWTEEDYTKNITRPRKYKGPLLRGDCEIKLRKGVASIGHIAFTDNSKSMRNEKFRLGAKTVKGLPPGVVVKAAVTEAFRVKERRLRSAKSRSVRRLPKIDTSTNQFFDQELTNLSIIQGQEQEQPLRQPPPPPSGNFNVSGFVHTLDAGSLSSKQMGGIPPTNVYHDTTATNQAELVEHVNGYMQTPMPDSLSLEDIRELDSLFFEDFLELENQFNTDVLHCTPQQEGRGNVSDASAQGHVTSKLIAACYVTKAAALFMVSVQQDANVPCKKRKL